MSLREKWEPGATNAKRFLDDQVWIRASTVATMRSQRAPAKAWTSPRARSISRSSEPRSSARARKRRVRTVASGMPSAAAVSCAVISVRGLGLCVRPGAADKGSSVNAGRS